MSTATEQDTARADGPASISFDGIPSEPRTWVMPGVLALGEVTIIAGVGGVTAKSMAMAKVAALTVLGLPMPGDQPGTVREPGRVLWVTSGTEDDPIHDLSPRFASALAACAAEHSLDPVTALSAERYIHNLSEWPGGDPIEIPGDRAKLRAEVAALNALDEHNRPAGHPHYSGPGPAVAVMLMDPLDALLGPGATIDSRPGARRVMAHLGRLARSANVALAIIHHVIASGTKIAGSPALTNSVRLAFMVTPDKGNESVKVMHPVKSNVSSPDDLRWVVVPSEPAPFVAFLGEVAATRADTADTLRARIEQVNESHDKARPGSPVKVLVRSREPGQDDQRRMLGVTWDDRDAARQAADSDAGQALTWAQVTGRPGFEAATVRTEEKVTAYVISPA